MITGTGYTHINIAICRNMPALVPPLHHTCGKSTASRYSLRRLWHREQGLGRSHNNESEHVPQPQLDHPVATAAEDLARVRVCKSAIPRVRYARSGRRGSAQVEMVEGVEKVGAKLHPVRLPDGE